MQWSAYLPLGLPQEVRGGEGGISANDVATGGVHVVRVDAGEEHKVGDILRVGPPAWNVHQPSCMEQNRAVKTRKEKGQMSSNTASRGLFFNC